MHTTLFPRKGTGLGPGGSLLYCAPLELYKYTEAKTSKAPTATTSTEICSMVAGSEWKVSLSVYVNSRQGELRWQPLVGRELGLATG